MLGCRVKTVWGLEFVIRVFLISHLRFTWVMHAWGPNFLSNLVTHGGSHESQPNQSGIDLDEQATVLGRSMFHGHGIRDVDNRNVLLFAVDVRPCMEVKAQYISSCQIADVLSIPATG